MTKSVTIVNTSNWEGENIQFKIPDPTSYAGFRYVTLRPGKTLELGPSNFGVIEVIDKPDEVTKPFYKPQEPLPPPKQVFPQVEVKFK